MAVGLVLGIPVVTRLQSDRIGYGGGTIVIEGDVFATDGFSQFDPSKGNKVIHFKTHFRQLHLSEKIVR